MNDIKFNVFDVDDKQCIYPLSISNKICDKTCNLLLIENNNKKSLCFDDKQSIYLLYISNKICDKTCNLL